MRSPAPPTTTRFRVTAAPSASHIAQLAATGRVDASEVNVRVDGSENRTQRYEDDKDDESNEHLLSSAGTHTHLNAISHHDHSSPGGSHIWTIAHLDDLRFPDKFEDAVTISPTMSQSCDHSPSQSLVLNDRSPTPTLLTSTGRRSLE